jgi:hypothetical protein
VSVYGLNLLSRTEVSICCNKFEDGRTALYDDPEEHRGTQRSSHNDENCVAVESFDKGRPKFVK